jgi:hypothetical protein
MTRKNDLAWEKFIVSQKIQLDGNPKYVNASELKRVTGREPRLLAKFDSDEDLPNIFRKNQYSILPVKNGEYVLIKENVIHQVNKCTELVNYRAQFPFPLYTLGRNKGESNFIDTAYHSGMLNNFCNCGKLYLTIRGRERASNFSFGFANSRNHLTIEGVQIEVDAGFEGENDIILVEAKVGFKDYLNIRQLYYPYRHFLRLVPNKKIRTLYFVYDLPSDTYNFYEFSFSDESRLDSISLLGCMSYQLITPIYEDIQLINSLKEFSNNIVPQADDINKIYELLTAIDDGYSTKDEIAEFFNFEPRQALYYGEAAEYLGLINRIGGNFELSDIGSSLITVQPQLRQQYFAQCVRYSWIIRELFSIAEIKGSFSVNDIDNIISSVPTKGGISPRYSGSTIKRRRQTIVSWLGWLASEMNYIIEQDSIYSLPN